MYYPSELLLFSERTYWRLFLLHNEAWWPLPVFTMMAGIGLLLALRHPGPVRLKGALAGLGLLWGFVALVWLDARYATINWAARYAVPIGLLEGAALIASTITPGSGDVRQSARHWPARLGLGMTVYAVLIHPLTAVFREPGIKSAEVFGMAPDPLAIATLGLLVLVGRFRVAVGLSVIPTVWLLISGITLYTLGTVLCLIPLGAAVLGWVALIGSR